MISATPIRAALTDDGGYRPPEPDHAIRHAVRLDLPLERPVTRERRYGVVGRPGVPLSSGFARRFERWSRPSVTSNVAVDRSAGTRYTAEFDPRWLLEAITHRDHTGTNRYARPPRPATTATAPAINRVRAAVSNFDSRVASS